MIKSLQDVTHSLATLGLSSGHGITIALAAIASVAIVSLFLMYLKLTRAQAKTKDAESNEQRYRTLFEQSNDAIFIHINGKIVDVNERAVEMLKIPKDRLVQMCIEELHPDERPSLDSSTDGLQTISCDGSVTFDNMLIRSDGSVVDVEISSRIVDDQTGMIQRIVRDITERKRTERALRESEEYLSSTLNSIGDAVVATDAKGRIARMNPVAEEYSGVPFAVAKKERFSKVFALYDNGGDPFDNPAAKIFKTGIVTHTDTPVVLRHKNGKERLVTQTAGPIRSPSGRIIGIVLVYHDVTLRHQLEEDLRHAQKMESIGRITGEIAHDFNNQLSIIQGYADMLHTLAEGDRLKAAAQRIVESANNAASLTSKLLAFSRKESLQNVDVDIHLMIEDVIELQCAHKRGISFESELNAEFCTITGDPSSIQNAFLNLCINARDAMPDGGRLRFETSIEELDEDFCSRQKDRIQPGTFIHVSVADTGTGIPPETLCRVFEPYFTTKERSKGTGLGLAGVYGTAKAHKGLASVESIVGEGTAFHLYFPLKESACGADADDGRTCLEVLVVDDEPFAGEVAVDGLRRMGHRVSYCNDGAAAVERYRDSWQRTDMVMLDMVMPGMSGKETFAALREINPNVRVVVVTGFALDEDVQGMLEGGAVGLIAKPYEIAQLEECVKHAGATNPVLS